MRDCSLLDMKSENRRKSKYFFGILKIFYN